LLQETMVEVSPLQISHYWVTDSGSTRHDAHIGNSPTTAATSGLSSLTAISVERSTMEMKGSSRGNVS
jgi:hypothetical protein